MVNMILAQQGYMKGFIIINTRMKTSMKTKTEKGNLLTGTSTSNSSIDV